MKNIGGKREGAGRKTIGNDPKQVSILLTAEQRRIYEEMGGAKWVRAFIEAQGKKTPDGANSTSGENT